MIKTSGIDKFQVSLAQSFSKSLGVCYVNLFLPFTTIKCKVITYARILRILLYYRYPCEFWSSRTLSFIEVDIIALLNGCTKRPTLHVSQQPLSVLTFSSPVFFHYKFYISNFTTHPLRLILSTCSFFSSPTLVSCNI